MKQELNEISDLMLERFVAGELDAKRNAQIQMFCETDSVLQERVNGIRKSNEEILTAYEPKAMAIAIQRRQQTRLNHLKQKKYSLLGAENGRQTLRQNLFKLRYGFPALATLIVGIFLTLRPMQNQVEIRGSDASLIPLATETPDILLKGTESGLVIFRKTKLGTELLLPHDKAKAGDILQVFYHNRKSVYGMIFSRDGAGNMTLHFPETEGPALKLQEGNMQGLPNAFRLDQAPKYERFYLLTSSEPFACDSLLRLIRREFAFSQNVSDTLMALPSTFRQYTYTIEKEISSSHARPQEGK